MALTTTTIKFGNQRNLQVSQFSAASKIPANPWDARTMSNFVSWEESVVVNFSKQCITKQFRFGFCNIRNNQDPLKLYQPRPHAPPPP